MAGPEPSPEILSRKDATLRGLKHYFTGVACKRGHISLRYVSGLRCVDCAEGQRKKWRSDNPQRARELRMEWARKNPEKEREGAKRARAKLWNVHRNRFNNERREARKENPEPFRIVRNRSFKKLYREDPQRFIDAAIAWRTKNPEKFQETAKKASARWDEKNPFARRAIASRRRAWKKERGGEYTSAEVADILRLQKGRCGYCKKVLKDKFHVDHIMALSRGGSNECKNLQILCVRCNLTKSARDPIDHARTLGLLL